tara:strand:+ start:659 stop:994 length:336 start_codon:yes stop_codon:yes gene_type:complete
MTDDTDILETLLGIANFKEHIEKSKKDKVIMSIEEGDEESEFSIRIFDISDDTEQETLIKEVAYGVLSMLQDENKLNSIRSLGRYELAVNKQNKSSPIQHIGDNIVPFTPR